MSIVTGIGGAVREFGNLPCGVDGVKRELDKAYGGVGGAVRELFGSWDGRIYDNGNEFVGTTGGIIPSSGNSGSITVTKRPSELYTYTYRGGGKNAAAFMTSNKINLARYKYLKFNIKEAQTSYSTYIGQIGLCIASPNFDMMNGADGLYGRVKTVDVRQGAIPSQLDISDCNGDYYIYFGCNEGNASNERYIILNKIWLE